MDTITSANGPCLLHLYCKQLNALNFKERAPYVAPMPLLWIHQLGYHQNPDLGKHWFDARGMFVGFLKKTSNNLEQNFNFDLFSNQTQIVVCWAKAALAV